MPPYPFWSLLLLVAIPTAAQQYGRGVGKTTHTTSDADGALQFMLEHLPTTQDPYGPCDDNEYCTCGVLGRVTCDTSSSSSSSGGKGFGVHTVQLNARSTRPSCNLSAAEIEGNMTAALRATPQGSYDAFMDYNTGFWVSNLDPYIQALAPDDEEEILSFFLEWSDEVNGREYYSFLVQVPNTIVLVELMSAKQTLMAGRPRYRAPHPRFVFSAGATPASVFGPLDDPGAARPTLRPARVSQPTTDAARDQAYFGTVFAADVLRAPAGGSAAISPSSSSPSSPRASEDEAALLLAMDFNSTSPGAYVQVHLVQRPTENTSSPLSVGGWEDAMNSCHRQTYQSPVCGWDAHNDNHWALSQPTRTAQQYVDGFNSVEQPGGLYHVFYNAHQNISFYAIAPNGFTVQIAAPPLGGYDPAPLVPGGAAGDLCGQGNCRGDFGFGGAAGARSQAGDGQGPSGRGRGPSGGPSGRGPGARAGSSGGRGPGGGKVGGSSGGRGPGGREGDDRRGGAEHRHGEHGAQRITAPTKTRGAWT